jgi:hypothetical protein
MLLVGEANVERFLIPFHDFTKGNGYLLVIVVFTVVEDHNVSLVWRPSRDMTNTHKKEIKSKIKIYFLKLLDLL